MIVRFLTVFALGMGFITLSGSAAEVSPEKSKKALQALHEFIGAWDGKGDSSASDKKDAFWKESMTWGWSFKKDGIALIVEFKNSKYFEKGLLKYVGEKEGYEFTLTDKSNKQLVFKGQIKRGILEMTRIDPETKDEQIITMSTNNDGARFVYEMKVRIKGKGIAKKLYLVQHTKEGESIGTRNENECIVTGGKGTIPVSFGGKTYYVCCSGCRDAFNESPEKFVKEFEAKKKK